MFEPISWALALVVGQRVGKLLDVIIENRLEKKCRGGH